MTVETSGHIPAYSVSKMTELHFPAPFNDDVWKIIKRYSITKVCPFKVGQYFCCVTQFKFSSHSYRKEANIFMITSVDRKNKTVILRSFRDGSFVEITYYRKNCEGFCGEFKTEFLYFTKYCVLGKIPKDFLSPFLYEATARECFRFTINACEDSCPCFIRHILEEHFFNWTGRMKQGIYDNDYEEENQWRGDYLSPNCSSIEYPHTPELFPPIFIMFNDYECIFDCKSPWGIQGIGQGKYKTYDDYYDDYRYRGNPDITQWFDDGGGCLCSVDEDYDYINKNIYDLLRFQTYKYPYTDDDDE